MKLGQKFCDITDNRVGADSPLLVLPEGMTGDQFIDAMQRSIKHNPKSADTYYEFGLMLMKNAATIPDSAAQFEKFLQIEPKGERAETAKSLLAAAKAAK